MITLTRTSESDAKSASSPSIATVKCRCGSRAAEVVEWLTQLGAEDADRLVDHAAFYGVIVIHEHG